MLTAFTFWNLLAQTNLTKLLSTAKRTHWDRKNTRQPATAETMEWPETLAHTEHRDVMIFVKSRDSPDLQMQTEILKHSSRTSDRGEKTDLAQPESHH